MYIIIINIIIAVIFFLFFYFLCADVKHHNDQTKRNQKSMCRNLLANHEIKLTSKGCMQTGSVDTRDVLPFVTTTLAATTMDTVHMVLHNYAELCTLPVTLQPFALKSKQRLKKAPVNAKTGRR